MESKDIFDIVKPNDNLFISKLSKSEMDEFIFYVNKYMLDLRDSIGLGNKDTFGVEIEFDNISDWDKFCEIQSNYKDFDFVRDDSVDNGREAISSKLTDKLETWVQLSKLLNDLSKCSNINLTCGGHIHVGAHLLKGNLDNYIKLAKIFAAYENIIFRFGYGEFLTERLNFDKYYMPILKLVYMNEINASLKVYKQLFYSRQNALNFNVFYNEIPKCIKIIDEKTVEFRSSNGSLNPIVWQNNINFFIKLMKYASSNKFDEDLVLSRLKKLYSRCNDKNNKLLYRELDIEGAIQIADLIFDKVIDKVYFLRQYIKNFEVGTFMMEKGTKFTKSKNY